jgi:hypothetical protein
MTRVLRYLSFPSYTIVRTREVEKGEREGDIERKQNREEEPKSDLLVALLQEELQ